MPIAELLKSEKFKSMASLFWAQIALPLVMVIVGIVVFQPIEKWWTGGDKYIVYLVGNKNDSETQRIFRSVQQESALAKMRFDGREIEVEEEDDKGQLETARDKAKEIIADRRTLLVIGHVSGDITKETLSLYMAASPRVPIITTRESTPRLLDGVSFCLTGKAYCPIIPLSPTDDTQAETMLSFAIKSGKRKFLILEEDEDRHRAYSENLATTLKNDIKKKPSMDYVDTKQISAMTSFADTLATIERYKPSCIFYAGGPDTLLKFNDYLGHEVDKGTLLGADRPMLISSDGGVSEDLIDRPHSGSIYITHQLSSLEYQQQYHVYGVDSVAVISQLISQARELPDFHELGAAAYMRHVVNMHRVEDAREDLARVMKENAESSTPYVGRKGRVYNYFGKYQRLEGYFHVWQIADQKIVEADEHDGTLSPP